MDSKDNDVSGRNASLELCYALYLSLGECLLPCFPPSIPLISFLTIHSTDFFPDLFCILYRITLCHCQSSYSSHYLSSLLAPLFLSALLFRPLSFTQFNSALTLMSLLFEFCYVLCAVMYCLIVGGELSKLSKLMGSDLSERSSSMVSG